MKKALVYILAVALPAQTLAVAKRSQETMDTLLEIVRQNPLKAYDLNISEEQRHELFQRIEESAATAQPSQTQPSELDGLVHKVNNGVWDPLGWIPGSENYNKRMQQQNQEYQQQPHPNQQQRIRTYDQNGKLIEPTIKMHTDIPMEEPNFGDRNADWRVKYFRMIIVINKAAKAQFAQVYFRGASKSHMQLLKNMDISTGREGKEWSLEDKQYLGIPSSGHDPAESYHSNTPTGYYTPYWLHIDHISGDWEGAPMDHAVMFHSQRGLGMHKAPTAADSCRLGTRASGACVREDADDARELFWQVRSTGGPIMPEELEQTSAPHCGKPGVDRPACLARQQARKQKLSFRNELAEAGNFSTEEEAFQIPVLRDGKIVTNANGEIQLENGRYKTLIMIGNWPNMPVPEELVQARAERRERCNPKPKGR